MGCEDPAKVWLGASVAPESIRAMGCLRGFEAPVRSGSLASPKRPFWQEQRGGIEVKDGFRWD